MKYFNDVDLWFDIDDLHRPILGMRHEEEDGTDMDGDGHSHDDSEANKKTELPIRQMSILCFACFCEQY